MQLGAALIVPGLHIVELLAALSTTILGLAIMIPSILGLIGWAPTKVVPRPRLSERPERCSV